ncbi:amino acid ABC transporter permease [Mesorhizobium sp. M3A.F.Ca.ET.174.01.1.1]|uniref:amino acid ABC transporter permease n=1 Tax=unclassified Mesorhizobium TaxID=325217 RepID=UPI0010936B8B|nr:MULTISPECIES: amino acid ABC transporter permease [unclassified Mesorhizobium]TGS81048.1 amino acid ABC transporter permease [Mesorhizobium sp. M3A.F.Ca.ET.175.01.1.1]TGT21770.1 amino acid ABC transporter permease [Mesorhizobium sp. M3A.F.Ca.ET.174.01.1.1]
MSEPVSAAMPDEIPAGTGIQRALTRNWRRMFAGRSSTMATLFAFAVLLGLVVPFMKWAILDADFIGSGPHDCRRLGACWVFIVQKSGQLAYGFYPLVLWWQVNISLAVLASGCVAVYMLARRYQIAMAIAVFMASVVAGFSLFGGNLPGMTVVPVEQWGGLSISLLLFTVGMGISFVFGGLLALGRRSRWLIVRAVCSVYVEFMRGVPLISILFVAVILLPLFMPGGAEANLFMRVLVGICLYTSSYMAESIRAGLDAVPRESREAVYALGLSRWNGEKLVVFPQALIVALPGLVNTLIALMKDTSLILIVGMHDFLGSTRLAMGDVAWGNVLWEGYLFAGVIYFLLCFGLSSLGAHIERKADRYRLRAMA